MAKGLGRGFESLIPTDIVEDDFDITLSEDSSKSQLMELDLAKITPETDQPRKDFSEEKIQELAQSIRFFRRSFGGVSRFDPRARSFAADCSGS